MRRFLSILLALCSGCSVFGQIRTVSVLTNGALAAPLNFFVANSNLLNAAIAPAGGVNIVDSQVATNANIAKSKISTNGTWLVTDIPGLPYLPLAGGVLTGPVTFTTLTSDGFGTVIQDGYVQLGSVVVDGNNGYAQAAGVRSVNITNLGTIYSNNGQFTNSLTLNGSPVLTNAPAGIIFSVNGTASSAPNITNTSTLIWDLTSDNVNGYPTNLADAQIASGAAISESKISGLTSDLSSKLPLAGGTMTGSILGNATNDLGSAGSRFHDLSLGHNADILGTLAVAGETTLQNAGPSNLLRTDGNSKVKPVTVGSGIAFDGTNLTSTGLQTGSANLTNWSALSTNDFVNKVGSTMTAGGLTNRFDGFVGNGAGLTNIPESGVTSLVSDLASKQTGSSNLTNWSAVGTNAFVNTNGTGFPALTGDVTTVQGAVATTIAANAVTDAKFRQGVARSVVGVTGNSTANTADIQGTTDQVLRVNGAGTALAFGAIDLSKSAAATGVVQAASFPALTGDITTVAGAVATTLKNTGTAGTYRSVTFDAQGRETSGSNPTTFSGYGISDTAANLGTALGTQTANTVFAGPTSGGAATPTMRALVAADIPSLSATYLPLAGGTMTGALLFTDNTYDIGATAATRPRTLYLATSGIIQKDAIGTTPADALVITNSTAANTNAQQYSGALRFDGKGWATTGSSNQPVAWRIYEQPVQGSANPSANLLFDWSYNGGAFVTFLTVGGNTTGSGGNLTFNGNVVAQGNTTVNASSYFIVSGKAIASSPTDGIWLLQNNAANNFTRLDFGGTTATFPAWTRTLAGFTLTGGDGTANSTNNLIVPGTLSVTNGVSSLDTTAAVNIAAGGFTNTFNGNATVYIDGTGVTFTVYNTAGTAVYTNAATVTHATVNLQKSGKVLVTAGTGVTGVAVPF